MKQDFLIRLYQYQRFRPFIRWFVKKTEGGEMYSRTLRELFKRYHQIEVGLYSYGCFSPGRIAPMTRIGRYCSFASGVCTFNGNHPLEHLSLHPFFYNPVFGYVSEEKISRGSLEIGNDVWIGRNAIITPSVRRIGNGAVIGAGAVVTHDIPDFAVAAGNPARIIKYRFSPSVIETILRDPWWQKDIDELKGNLEKFTRPYVDVIGLSEGKV